MTPLDAALRALEAPGSGVGIVYLEHTGGGNMAVVVPTAIGSVVVTYDGTYTIGFYADQGWDDGADHDDIVYGIETPDDVVAAVLKATDLR